MMKHTEAIWNQIKKTFENKYLIHFKPQLNILIKSNSFNLNDLINRREIMKNGQIPN